MTSEVAQMSLMSPFSCARLFVTCRRAVSHMCTPSGRFVVPPTPKFTITLQTRNTRRACETFNNDSKFSQQSPCSVAKEAQLTSIRIEANDAVGNVKIGIVGLQERPAKHRRPLIIHELLNGDPAAAVRSLENIVGRRDVVDMLRAGVIAKFKEQLRPRLLLRTGNAGRAYFEPERFVDGFCRIAVEAEEGAA